MFYSSGSQPFGLQVPVKGKFSSYCPGPKKCSGIESAIFASLPKITNKCWFCFHLVQNEVYSLNWTFNVLFYFYILNFLKFSKSPSKDACHSTSLGLKFHMGVEKCQKCVKYYSNGLLHSWSKLFFLQKWSKVTSKFCYFS